MNIFYKRQGQVEPGQMFFYTQTINGFYHLLKNDDFKMIIINSLKHLAHKKLIQVYGYVIMPNHFHLLWNILENNGKESPAGSLAKFTAHQFKKILKDIDINLLHQFMSEKNDFKYQFWKAYPLAIPLSTITIVEQKLDYIHNNPVQEKWQLSLLPENYRWSNASFYENGYDEFGFLTHYRD